MTIRIEPIIEIARDVGNQILMPNWGNVEGAKKADGSDVTEVDKQASAYIIENLKALNPDIPVISEEAPHVDNQRALQSPLYWLIDPLDGTTTYLEGKHLGLDAGFGVHIALIEDGNPTRGVAYFPAQNRMYYTGNDGSAYLQVDENIPEKINVSEYIDEDGDVFAAVPWVKAKRPELINGRHPYVAVPAVGGEMVCKVADGEADVMWLDRQALCTWDVAAAHAILKAAGGNLYDLSTKKPILYTAPDFKLPACAAGHPSLLGVLGFKPYASNQKSTLTCDLS